MRNKQRGGGQAGFRYTYQWVRADSDGTATDIPDAADETYTVTVSDMGKSLRVRAMFTDDWNSEEARESDGALVPDTRPPELIRATVNASELVLTYDEVLDEASVPAAGAFVVTVAGSTIAVSGVSVTGSRVLLTLATAVRDGQTFTLDYTPGTDPIQDVAGNDAAPLSGQTAEAPASDGPAVSIGDLDVPEDIGTAVVTLTLDRPSSVALVLSS